MGKNNWKDGKQHGLTEWYNENGQIELRGYHKNGKPDGYWESYWENNQLSDVGNYKNGKRDGYWAYFNKDGSVKADETGTYINGVKQD